MAPTSVEVPKTGGIEKSVKTKKVLSAITKKSPLENLSLALDDWGQSPWRLQRIVSEASLLFERNSKDADKKSISEQTKANVESRIAAMKSHYEEVVKASGPKDEVARKLADDISFMESIYAFTQAQVNGLVSLQKSWKARSDNINDYYAARIELGWWDKAKKQFPWLNGAIGAGAGVAAWAWNGWDAIVLAVQAGVKAGMNAVFGIDNPETQRMVDDIVKLAVNVGGIIGLMKFTSFLDDRFLKRKARLQIECAEAQKRIIDEEKQARRELLSLVKEKAIELNAKYGYLLELEKEDPEMHRFAKNDEFGKINAAHKARVKKILGADVPDNMITAAESDTNSTDISTLRPIAEKIITDGSKDSKGK